MFEVNQRVRYTWKADEEYETGRKIFLVTEVKPGFARINGWSMSHWESIENLEDATVVQDVPQMWQDLCPVCNEPAQDQCRCPEGHFTCAEKHIWNWVPIIERFAIAGDNRWHRRVSGFRVEVDQRLQCNPSLFDRTLGS